MIGSLRAKLWLVIATAGLIGISVFGAYPFVDNAEGGTGNWSLDSPWGITNVNSHSASNSFTDSPGSNYANNLNISMTQSASMNLGTAVRPLLSFWHRYSLESGYDFGYVEISLNGGTTWEVTPLATFTGNSLWKRTQIDLSSYAGQTNVKIRFRLTSDPTVTQDGWYIDDILISEGPDPVTMNSPSGATSNTLFLSWTASSEPSFAAYRIVRGMSPGFDWKTGTVVATITNISTTSTTDISLSPKTTYYYRIIVVKTNELETPSNETSGATLPGMDFPFLDNGEAGSASWVADAPWALSTEAYHSSSNSWSDSPGGYYENSLSGVSLTISSPLNLTSTTNPMLSFWHIYG